MASERMAFIRERERLLVEIRQGLYKDERFTAAWLVGSDGRGEQTWYSDLEVQVVVAEAQSQRTKPERLALFERFGRSVVVYEDQTEGPEGGTATTVLYASAITVRWMLLPQARAQRPREALRLFEKVAIPPEPPYQLASLQERLKEAAVQLAFFWLMMPIILKYIIRHDPVFFDLHLPLEKVERLIAGTEPSGRVGWGVELYRTQQERIGYLLDLCRRAQQLSAQVQQLGGRVPETTLPIIELWREMVRNPQRRKQYAADREELLARIVSAFQTDERIIAAWVEGSYAHGNKDDLSDIDLRVVVADAQKVLCEVPWESPSFQTTPERQGLLSQFGEPLIAWDTQTFASIAERGSFTLVYYKTTGVHVDWVLIPQDKAERPVEASLLFDKVGIALKPEIETEGLEKRLQRISDNVGLFWMVAAESWQYLAKQDFAYYHVLLERLQNIVGQVRADVEGVSWGYTHTRLYETREKQVVALRRLCEEMEQLMPEVARMGGYVPADAYAIIEKRLELLAEE